MFYAAGNYEGKILAFTLAESRFSPNDPEAFDVALHIEGPEHEGKPQDDWWRGEVSSKFGRGVMSGKTQYEITMQALRGIGFEGQDLTKLDELVGKEIPFKVESREYEGKTYYDIKYIGGGNYAPKALPKDEIARKLEAIKSKAAQHATAGLPKANEAKQDEEEDIPW